MCFPYLIRFLLRIFLSSIVFKSYQFQITNSTCRYLKPHINQIATQNKSVAKNLLEDIEFLQWSTTSNETFHQNFYLLERKYMRTMRIIQQKFWSQSSSTTCDSGGWSQQNRIGLKLVIPSAREITKELKVWTKRSRDPDINKILSLVQTIYTIFLILKGLLKINTPGLKSINIIWCERRGVLFIIFCH